MKLKKDKREIFMKKVYKSLIGNVVFALVLSIILWKLPIHFYNLGFDFFVKFMISLLISASYNLIFNTGMLKVKKVFLLQIVVSLMVLTFLPYNGTVVDLFNDKEKQYPTLHNIENAWTYSDLVTMNQSIAFPIIDTSVIKVVEISEKDPIFLKKFDFTNLENTLGDNSAISYQEFDYYTLWYYEWLGVNVYGRYFNEYYDVDDIEAQLEEILQ